MSQSTFLAGSLLVAFIAWTILRGTFGVYLSFLGLGAAAAVPAGNVTVGPITSAPAASSGIGVTGGANTGIDPASLLSGGTSPI